jgi:Resolvase, N terminal domain
MSCPYRKSHPKPFQKPEYFQRSFSTRIYIQKYLLWYGVPLRFQRISEAINPKRAAIYVRVSTDKQTVENQLHELRQIAERRGWGVVQEYQDAGISGSKGREARPGLDEMLKDASSM